MIFVVETDTLLYEQFRRKFWKRFHAKSSMSKSWSR